MKAIGWILTVLGCIWALTGTSRIIAATIGAIPGKTETHIVVGVLTLLLAALAIWGGKKLRNRGTTSTPAAGSPAPQNKSNSEGSW
jgi:hypothetical protein